MKEYVNYNGTIQEFEDGELLRLISKDDAAELLNQKELQIAMLDVDVHIARANRIAAEKQSSDDRWAADAANGLLSWGA